MKKTPIKVEPATETKVSDVKVVGNPDNWQLICKTSSEEEKWMQRTEAMQVPLGCIVRVTTQRGENVAEALTFVPGVSVYVDVQSNKFIG